MKQEKGNLLKMFKGGKFDVIVHGCNCFHIMGAGIAGQLAKEYPQVMEADYMTFRGDYEKLSNWSAAFLPNNQIIINLYTQFLPGRDLNENALFLGFEKLTRHYIGPHMKVGIPAIGCGIAGGNWDRIYPVLDAITKGLDFTYVQYVPDTEELIEEELISNYPIS